MSLNKADKEWIVSAIAEGIKPLSDKIDAVDAKVDAVDAKVDAVDAKLDKHIKEGH